MAFLVVDIDANRIARVNNATSEPDAIKQYVIKHMGSAAGDLDIAGAIESFNGYAYDEGKVEDIQGMGATLAQFPFQL